MRLGRGLEAFWGVMDMSRGVFCISLRLLGASCWCIGGRLGASWKRVEGILEATWGVHKEFLLSSGRYYSQRSF